MLDQITIIAFDLDDTLWPCMPTIERAEQVLYRWLDQHCPRITARYNLEEMTEQRKQFMQSDERFKIDLSFMRREFLRKLAVEAGYDADQVMEQAFDVFFQARQDVSFYDDVFPSLERLSEDYRLGSISNGNASVDHVGLGHLFDHSVSASDIQVAKPDRQIYHNLVERFGVCAEQVLYVGDHPEYDVIGPQEAGLHAIWINRDDKIWPEHLVEPKYQISNLIELETLMAG